MAQPSKSAYDFYLTIDSVKYGFMLAEQDGVKQLNDGLAPFISPQFATGSYSIEDTPPEIEVSSVAERLSDGCGYDLGAVGGGSATTRYNYSRGLDLSHEDRIFLSPLQQPALESDATAIAAAPVRFLHSSLGFFMLAGAYIYKFDLTTGTWVQKDDATGTFSGVAYKDIVELDGVLYASRGSTADYKYSTDGNTWTAFTDADENADYFTIRGNSSDVASVWKVLTNLIKGTVNGANSGTAWSGADEVGHTAETVTGMITVNNDIWVFKKEGVYIYDGTNTQDFWKTKYHVSTNGRNPFQFANGKLYAPYGRRLLEIDPLAQDTTITPVFPLSDMDSLEIKGDITAIGGDDYFMYLAVKNTAGNTYIIKGRPGGSWHTFLYLGANDCNALYVTPGGVTHATNPCLVIGYGTAAPFYILARENVYPGDDPLYEFSTTEGVAYGSYINYGAKNYSKFLNRGAILGDHISAGRPVTLKYEKDRSGTETTLVSATSDGLTEANESSEVSFNQLRWVLYASTGDSAASPAVDSLALFSTLNPPRKHMWQPIVAMSDDLELRGGVEARQQPSSRLLRNILFGAVTKRITLTDDEANTFVVRLLDIQSTGRVKKMFGGKEHDAMGYQLKMVEIQAIATDQSAAIYGESAYGSSHVFA